MGHLATVLVKLLFKAGSPLVELGEVHLGHLANMLAVDEETERLLFQTVSVTMRAGDSIHKTIGPFLYGCRLVVGGHLADIVGNAGEATAVTAFAIDVDAHIVAGAIEDYVKGLVAEIGQRVVEREVVEAAKAFQLAVHIVGGGVFAQNVKSAVTYAFLWVWDDLF